MRNSAGKPIPVVGAVAKGFVGGSPASAKIDRLFIGNDPSVCIHNPEISAYFQGATFIYLKKRFYRFHSYQGLICKSNFPMRSIAIGHTSRISAPAKGSHACGLQLPAIASNNRKLPIHYDGAIFHDPDVGGLDPFRIPGDFALRFHIRGTCKRLRVLFLCCQGPLVGQFGFRKIAVIFPYNGLRRALVYYFNDASGRCSFHIYPGPSAGIKHLNQFPETGGGMNAFGWNPEDRYLSVCILSVSRVAHGLNFGLYIALKNNSGRRMFICILRCFHIKKKLRCFH
jgi:hypothetical protein